MKIITGMCWRASLWTEDTVMPAPTATRHSTQTTPPHSTTHTHTPRTHRVTFSHYHTGFTPHVDTPPSPFFRPLLSPSFISFHPFSLLPPSLLPLSRSASAFPLCSLHLCLSSHSFSSLSRHAAPPHVHAAVSPITYKGRGE